MLLKSDTQLNAHSYYEASVERPPPQSALQGTESADVVIVGAGFTGLSAALELAQRGYQVVVLEADRICSGASGRNGGQTIVGYASGQGPFEQQLGAQSARLAWNMSIEANRLVDERIAAFDIACDRVKGYLHVADSARKARALQEDQEAMQRDYGFDSELRSGDGLREWIDSPRYCAGYYERESGHLHPLKFGLGLARAAQSLGVRIYERSAVTRLSTDNGVVAGTVSGEVRARWGILAGNYSLPEFGPQVAKKLHARIMPVGTYIIGTAPLDPALHQRLLPQDAAVCDNNFVLDYFRFSADHRMLFGGRVSYTTRTPLRLRELMAARMAQVFPALAGVGIEFVWGGFVDITMNRAPDFGRIGNHCYYLQGFSGHGVALTGLAGRLVADALTGQAERFDVFARLQHLPFPGGPWLRTPSLALGMLYYRLRDAL